MGLVRSFGRRSDYRYALKGSDPFYAHEDSLSRALASQCQAIDSPIAKHQRNRDDQLHQYIDRM